MEKVCDIVLPFIRRKLKCRVVCRAWMKQMKMFPVEILVFESDQAFRTVPYRRQERQATHAIVSSEKDAKRKLKAVRNISNIIKRVEFLGFRETKCVTMSYCDARLIDLNPISTSRKIEFIGCDYLVLPKKCTHLYIDQSNVTMEDLRAVYHDRMKFVSARFTPALRTFLLSVIPEYDTYVQKIKRDIIRFSELLDLVASRIMQRRDHFSRLDMLIWRSNYEARFDDVKSAVRELVLDCYSAVVFPPPSHFLTTYQQFLASDIWISRRILDFTSIVTAEGTSRPCSLAVAVESFKVSTVSLILERGRGNPQYSCTSSEDSVCSLIVATARDSSPIIQDDAVKILSMFLPYIRKPSRKFRLGWTYVHFVAQEIWRQTRRERLGLTLLRMLLDVLAIPPSVQDFDGTTPLMVAALAGNIEIVQELSRRMSASELMMTDDSGTALQAAVKAGHERCVNEIANAMFCACDTNDFDIKDELRLALNLSQNRDIESEEERLERRNIVRILIHVEDLVLEERSIRNITRRKRKRKRHRSASE